ncbi:MAG: DUF502 domain-containing protein [bacterium]
MKNLRNYFIAGLAALMPISLTVFVVWFIVTRLGSLFRPLLAVHPWLARLPGWVATVSGFVFLMIIILAIGTLASGLLGRLALGWFDRVMVHVPVVKELYASARLLTDAVFVKHSSLRRTVIAEYPRPGFFAVGFVTSDRRVTLADGRTALFVFFPTAPNPTSGWLALIPEPDLTSTEMSIEDGLKMVMSGGVIRPQDLSALKLSRRA